MKITQVNTTDILGGAARAAYRLFLGLTEIGQDSNFLALEKGSTNDKVVEVNFDQTSVNEALNKRYKAIQNYYINRNRTEISNTKFTFGYPGYEIHDHPLIQSSDIVNLHWVEEFQSTITLKHLFDTSKQFVWTLHDERPFTGGYHYSAGCTQHISLSEKCELLIEDPYTLPYLNLKDKIDFFRDANLTIVTPSKWLAGEARKSLLFKDKDIRVIPNSLETEVFYPLDKKEAKKKCKINPNAISLLFACEDANEKRKGFNELLEAMRILIKDPEIIALKEKGLLELILIGIPNEDIESLNIKYHVTGVINDDNKMREVMSATDIFILPSLEDNLPNMMLESMACGTCVAAFATGGVVDVVENNINGLVVEKGNSAELANAVRSLILINAMREEFNKKSYELISKEFNLSVQAKRYLELYRELEKKNNKSRNNINFSKDHAAKLNYEVGPNLSKNLDKIAIQSLEGLIFDQEYALDELNTILHKIRNAPLYKIGKKIKILISKINARIFRKRKYKIEEKN